MYFDDRLDAARQLAGELSRFRGTRPLVLAVPRGAVPIGRVIAESLEGDLDVVLVRKLGAPGNPELAVGSIDESGWTYISEYARDAGIDERWLEEEGARQRELLRRRRAAYSPGRPGMDPAGRTCIVVDDGLATGATMIAALHSVRARAPGRLVCAAPVASREALARIARLADEIVCVERPLAFRSVGQFYRDFPQVEDAEVMRILAGGKVTARAA